MLRKETGNAYFARFEMNVILCDKNSV